MKSWDPVWEDIYRNREWGKYPSEELIRFVAGHYYRAPQRSKVKFLDLGCGVGAATWFLCREGFDVAALDGSATALQLLEQRLAAEHLTAELVRADASTLPFADGHFDCVIDLVCLMCNTEANARAIIDEVWRATKPGGRFFSFTPQTGCWGDGIGACVGPGTYADSEEGPFARMGTVRFLAEADIRRIYGRFPAITIDYVKRSVAGMKHEMAFWAISCQKL